MNALVEVGLENSSAIFIMFQHMEFYVKYFPALLTPILLYDKFKGSSLIDLRRKRGGKVIYV